VQEEDQKSRRNQEQKIRYPLPEGLAELLSGGFECDTSQRTLGGVKRMELSD
jgi:hypothetical protein